MGNQSIPKTIFILTAMIGWAMVGAALIYLFPALADQLFPSGRTHGWMETLGHSGYNPTLAWVGGGIALAVTVVGHLIWYQQFDDKF